MIKVVKFGFLIALIPAIALAAKPLQVVQAWTQAAKERNGKKQYQLLCANQQKKNLSTLKSLNWVTGVSSPSVASYTIMPLGNKQHPTAFLVKYQITLQNKPIGPMTDKIYIKNGCINEFKYLSPAAEDNNL